jgi:hypothetical protein
MKILTAIVALIASANVASAQEVPVPFLQAAIFFMFGVEGGYVKDVTGLPEQHQNFGIARHFQITAKAFVQATVYTKTGNTEGIWEATIRENDPCTIWADLVKPVTALNTNNPVRGDGNGGRRIEFNKMPSLRAFQYQNAIIVPGMVGSMYSPGEYTANLPDETWCSYRTVSFGGKIDLISGSGLCRTQVRFQDNSELDIRRFKALGYIQANYCKGQPEPPRKPY